MGGIVLGRVAQGGGGIPGPFIDPGGANPWLSSGAAGSNDAVEVGNAMMAKVASGDYRMLYEAIASGNTSYTCLATAAARTGPWTKFGGQNTPTAVLSPGAAGAWDDYQTVPTSALYLDSQGVWHYWYQGRRSTTTYQIGHATAASADWHSWTKDAGNPILALGGGGSWDSNIDLPCGLTVVGGDIRLWIQGQDGTTYRLGYATASSVAGPWTKYAGNPVFTASVAPNGLAVAYDADLGGYLCFYSNGSVLGVATSSDGIHWSDRGTRFTGRCSGCATQGLIGDAISVHLIDGVWMVIGHCYAAFSNGNRNSGYVSVVAR